MTKITQAFIFAAGRGERMKPLTDTIPKPLAQVKNKAIIDYILEKLSEVKSINKIIINGFHLADVLEAHLKKLNNKKIIFSKETDKFETGGGLLFAKDKINFDEPLLLINGDILWQDKDGISDIENLSRYYHKNDCDILLGLTHTNELFGYEGKGDFDFNKLSHELYKYEGNVMSHVYVGVQIINPQILKDAPSDCFSINHFYKKSVDEHHKLQRIKGFEMKGKYFHIGDVKSLHEVNKVF